MEAAFKQLMQQHTGNSEYVTLAMTDGKGLELVSDPSQFGAIMQAAANQQAQQLAAGSSQQGTSNSAKVTIKAAYKNVPRIRTFYSMKSSISTPLCKNPGSSWVLTSKNKYIDLVVSCDSPRH